MKQTDQELLQSIAASDEQAISELYDRYSQLIYGAILRIVAETDDAEDILQEVFIQIWRKASTYKPELGSPKNWMVRIAHNRSLNFLRSKRLRAKSAEITDEEITVTAHPTLIDDSLISKTISAERMELLRRVMCELPPDQAHLIDLAFFQGYSHSEISELLGVPLGTLKSKIRKGLLSMRGALDFMKEEFK